MAYADNFIPEIWSKKTQKIFDATTVMAKLVNRDYEGEIKAAGDTVHVRTFGDITIRNYTREGDLTLDTLTDPMSDLVIDQEKYFAFIVDDLDAAQADINIMEGYTKRAAIAIRNTVDQHLHAQYANAHASNIIGTSSVPIALTKDNIYFYCTELAKRLDERNVDMEGRHLVVDPARKQLLLNSPEFLRATDLGDRVVQNGRIGQIAGFDVHVSTNLNSSGGNRPLLAMTKDFISYASQVNKVEKDRPSLKFVDLVKGLYCYGSKVFTNHAACGAVLWASGT